MSILIVKFGGSLLTRTDLAERYSSLLEQVAFDRILVVSGGGSVADVVRDWHTRFRLSEAASHRIAMGSMSLSARLLAAIIPESVYATTRQEVHDGWQQFRTVILDADAFVREEEANFGSAPPDETPLPRSWQVTSDSVAAWIASRWPAGSLLLLKSTGLQGNTVASASACGLVDPWMPQVLEGGVLQPHWCDFTRDQLEINEIPLS